MEIFRVSPDRISTLDERQLVELTERLFHAEMKSNGIPLRSGIVQRQIHIPDGGEDGSVSWRGAPNDTDYFPCRTNIFQLKKSDPGPAGMKKEIWKKSSGKDGKPPELKDALKKALENSGSYIMITAAPIVGNQRDKRIKAIEDGIKETGGDPSLLVAIEIYDANKLAEWTNIHPTIALWLNSMSSGFDTLGLRTYDDWSKDEVIHKTAFQTTDEKRYRLRSAHIQNWKESNPDFEECQNLAQLRISITEFFKSFGRSLRITGPSGYGKTRLAHSILLPDDVQAGESLDPRQVVFCKYYKGVEQRLIPIATGIAQSGSFCTLVVDDCPDKIHQKLYEITRRQDSKLHIITLDVETRTEGVNGNLVIELIKASDELIDRITRSVAPNISHVDVSYVRELSQGFPSMAILGVEAIGSGDQKLSSVDALVSRIVWGNSQPDDEVYRSLQVLSLFTVLGIDNEAAEELKQVSNFLRRPYEEVFRDIIRLSNRGVIRRIGDFAEVQPVPLAARLESEWLDSSPSETLKELFRSLSPKLQLRMAGRLRWLSWSEKVQNFANQMLSELVPDFDKLDTKFGSEILDRFTHLMPSGVMARLESLLGKLSIDELTVLEETVGSNVVRVLEKLIFPAETFEKAAGLLLRLSGVENRCWSNNAAELFSRLFQLRLSGTEAEPKIKIRVLDAGLSSGDDRIRSICIKKALESMLRTGHFSRNCGHERIGVGEALKDWQPKSYEEIFEYYRLALIRLEEIALSKTDEFSRDAVNSISYRLCGILKSGFPCDEVIELIKRISSQVPRWWDGIKALNWSLYDDSGEMDNEVRQSILDAYFGLIPDDPIEKLLMFSSGWMGEFHDPEVPYQSDGDNHRHYAERMIKETVSSCPSEASFFSPLLNIWLDICLEGTNDSFETALSAIAEHVDDPVVFVTALRKEVSNDREVGICANFIRIVIGGAVKKNPSVGRKLLDEALQGEALRVFSPRMIASAGADDDLMAQVIEYINQGIVNSDQLGYLAPRNVLSDVSSAVIDRLVSALLSRGCEGAWSAISFLRIHTYGQSRLSALEADMIRRVITHTELFEKRHYDRMDSYYWKELTEKLFNHGYIDEDFAELITSVIIGLVDMKNSHGASDLIRDAGSVLEQITDLYPRVVWRQYHEKKAQMSEVGDYILNRLFNSDVSNSSKPGVLYRVPQGVLYRVPQEVMIPWLLEDRENRIGEVLEWIRLFDLDSVGSNASWSNDFISFVDNYIKESEELRPVYFRLMNGHIISGYYSKKLKIDRDHFEQLAEKTSNSSVKTWAASIINSLREEIQETQREEANREALDRV